MWWIWCYCSWWYLDNYHLSRWWNHRCSYHSNKDKHRVTRILWDKCIWARSCCPHEIYLRWASEVNWYILSYPSKRTWSNGGGAFKRRRGFIGRERRDSCRVPQTLSIKMEIGRLDKWSDACYSLGICKKGRLLEAWDSLLLLLGNLVGTKSLQIDRDHVKISENF